MFGDRELLYVFQKMLAFIENDPKESVSVDPLMHTGSWVHRAVPGSVC